MIYDKSYLLLTDLIAFVAVQTFAVGQEAKQKTKCERRDLKTGKMDMKTNVDKKEMKGENKG